MPLSLFLANESAVRHLTPYNCFFTIRFLGILMVGSVRVACKIKYGQIDFYKRRHVLLFLSGEIYIQGCRSFFPQGAGNVFIAAALLRSAREDRGFGCMWGFGGANPSFLKDCIITSCMDEEDAGVGRWRTEDGRRTRRRGGGDGDGSHSLVMLSFFLTGGAALSLQKTFFGSLGKYHSFYVKSAWWRNKCCGKGMTGTTFPSLAKCGSWS